MYGCVSCWDTGILGYWVAGILGCWDTGLLQFRRPYSLTLFIHSASLRSFTPFASPVKSDGCATPLFFVIFRL